MTDSLPPAGWYSDPGGLPQQRWWDGAVWTENVQPTAPVVETPPLVEPSPFPTGQYSTGSVAQPFNTGPVSAFPTGPVAASTQSGPIAQPFQTGPIANPFDFGAGAVATAGPARRPRRGEPEVVDVAETVKRAPGRLHFLALMTIGIVSAVAGLGLFFYATLSVTDAALKAQDQLIGGAAAAFGAFALLLWLAAGAIRQR